MTTTVHHVDSDVVTSAPGSVLQVENNYSNGNKPAPEFDLMCLCARTKWTLENRQHLRQILQKGVNWKRLTFIAEIHGVRPLVYHGLEQVASDLLPKNLLQGIQQYRRTTQIHNTFLVNELGRLTAAFRDRDIPALSLKGPILAKTAYGNIHLRRYTDLDVLIPRRCFSEVEKMLLEGDYQPFPKVQGLSGLRKKFYLFLSGQWPFMRGNGAFNLDLHTRVMPPGYTFPATFEPFWERSREIQLTEEVVVRGFAPEDMLLMLSFHGVKNQWALLKYACDITELIRSTPDLQWGIVRERAQAVRGEKVLKLGLYLADKLLDAPLLKSIRLWAEQKSATQETGAFLIDVLRQRHEGRMLDYDERVRFQLSVKDTFASKARYAAYSATQHLWSDVLQP